MFISTFGFENVDIKLSTRPEKRVGSDEVWDQAEAALAEALDAKGIKWELQEGEGAFYGPKIEFVLKDCLDREWQCGTLQVDFSMPERLDAHYIAQDNSKQNACYAAPRNCWITGAICRNFNRAL